MSSPSASAATVAQQRGTPSGALSGSPSARGAGAEMPGVKFYYAGVGDDGKKKTVGPFQFAQFKELVYTGEISLNTRVWRKGGEWRKLQKDEELLKMVAPNEGDMMTILAMQQ